jgi:glycosyltransferase involved in cell wall biosynthesis
MYNVAQYLQTCVRSVQEQHLQDAIYEVLMIDDGSPDQSRAVANNLAQEHAFIKVFSQENKGLGGARNTGIENAKGKYLVFLDADDILITDSLKKLLALAEKNTLDILEFGAHQINESGEVTATITWNGKGAVYKGITYYDKVKYMNSACNKLYLRQFLLDNDLQFTEKIYGEDFEFNTRSFFFAGKIMATDIIGASFLQSSNSITRNRDKSKKDKFVGDFVLILKKLNAFKNEHLDTKNNLQLQYFEERLSMCNLSLFYFLFKNNYSYREIKEIRKTLKSQGLYRNSYKVSGKKHDLFRKVMLKNFYLFRFTQPLKQVLGA